MNTGNTRLNTASTHKETAAWLSSYGKWQKVTRWTAIPYPFERSGIIHVSPAGAVNAPGHRA